MRSGISKQEIKGGTTINIQPR